MSAMASPKPLWTHSSIQLQERYATTQKPIVPNQREAFAIWWRRLTQNLDSTRETFLTATTSESRERLESKANFFISGKANNEHYASKIFYFSLSKDSSRRKKGHHGDRIVTKITFVFRPNRLAALQRVLVAGPTGVGLVGVLARLLWDVETFCHSPAPAAFLLCALALPVNPGDIANNTFKAASLENQWLTR